MRNSRFRKSGRALPLAALLLASPTVVSLQGCTDLDENPLSAITPENFYRNEEEVIGGLAGAYASLRSSLNAYYNVSEISTDEMIVPTRGQDWYDNGRWLEIHRQLWGANTGSTLGDLNSVWIDAFTGVARTNVILAALPKVSLGNKSAIEAELRTLRAFYYFMLMDMFGGVPIVTDTEIMPRPQNTRAEVFQFIEKELQEARQALPDRWPADMHGRMTRGAADAILASIYLNAEVFTGTPSANGLQRGQARWQDAITVADRILNSGVYSLATDWRKNFTADNHSSPENILVVKHLNAPGMGFNFLMRTLHYSQLSPSPWNGFATLAETYYAFDEDDRRRNIFLVGPQFNVETGQPVNDRTGARLVFTPEIRDATQATEGEGARFYKWPVDPNHVGAEHGNDYAYFRLAEIYLIKAEALNELGRTAEAIQILNMLRARVFTPNEPLSTGLSQAAARKAILDERLFELTAEAKRRQDLIRHNRFTSPWAFKEQREAFRVVMPIPQSQIDANPELQQNPGY